MYRLKAPSTVRSVVLGAVLGLVLAWTAGEVTVRALGTTDADGNFTFFNEWVRPRRLRLRTVAAALAAAERQPHSYIEYDPTLGWTIRPGTRSANGLYASNSLGIRSAPREYSPTPAEGRLRIVLLGDSFTHGSDVPYDATWGVQLENRLAETGVDAEVLNLGVGGYGFGQMYLRWKRLGARLAPQVVVLGFCQGDAARVVTFHWSLWHPTFAGNFTKPRFRLDDDGRLLALNLPTVPPKDVVDWLARFPHSDLARWEGGFDPADYQDHLWLASRLVAVADSALRSDAHWRGARDDDWSSGAEAGRVSAALVEALRADVESRGARFVTVSLPWRPDLERLQSGRSLGSDAFLARLAGVAPVVRTEPALLGAAAESSLDRLFVHGGAGHYSPAAHRIVARAVAAAILRRPAR